MEYDKRDSAEIRKLILTTLKEIKDLVPIDFTIEVIPNTEFGEDIVMALAPQDTHIEIPGAKKNHSTYAREGAKIVFFQIYSNGSEVSYRMSHIEGLTEKEKTQLQEKVPREQINREYILQRVLDFLQQVLEFER